MQIPVSGLTLKGQFGPLWQGSLNSGPFFASNVQRLVALQNKYSKAQKKSSFTAHINLFIKDS